MTLRQFYNGNLIKLMRHFGWVPERKCKVLEDMIKYDINIKATSSRIIVISPSGEKLNLNVGDTSSINLEKPKGDMRWVVRIMEENQ